MNDLIGIKDNKNIATKDISEVNRLLSQQIAKGTRRCYVSDFKIFTEWCKERELDALNASPEHIAIFLANQFELGVHPSTLNRRLGAIRFAYRSMQKLSPTENDIVRATLKGIKRDENAKKTKHKNPLTNHILISIIQYVPRETIRGLRDKAILLILFAGAFRLSELINLKYSDISFVDGGVDVMIYRSKTNQEGRRQMKSISRGDIFCPCTALQIWITCANIHDGYLFRTLTRNNKITEKKISHSSLYWIVKKYCQLAGYSLDHFSPHSLRAGFTTSAVENGKNIYKIMDVTLHSSVNSLKPYIKFSDRYKDHPGKGLL